MASSRQPSSGLLGRRVLGHGLGTLGHGVLGQFTGQEQTNGRLDLSAGDGRAAVVMRQAGSLGGNTLENVVDETVHDRHGLARDTGVGVHLLQHLVDVDAVGFLPPLLLFLVTGAGRFGLCHGFLGAFRRYFGRHSDGQRMNEANACQFSIYTADLRSWRPVSTQYAHF